jgi:hypothetical protein
LVWVIVSSLIVAEEVDARPLKILDAPDQFRTQSDKLMKLFSFLS